MSNKLCSSFKLKFGHFELRYSFTNCTNCLLESDDDLKIMFMVCRMMNDQLIHIDVRDTAVVNDVETVNMNLIASPFLLEVVHNDDNVEQDEDTCKDSSSTFSIVDSNATSSSCLSIDFDGSSSDFGNEYLGKYMVVVEVVSIYRLIGRVILLMRVRSLMVEFVNSVISWLSI